MEFIQSAQNQWVKLAASLKKKKYRDESGCFLLEGVRLVEELVQSDWQAEFAFVTPELGTSDRGRKLLSTLAAKCLIYQVTEMLLAKICDTKEPQGVMVVARQPSVVFSEVAVRTTADTLVVLADGIQDPGNLGTLIRTADAVGCNALILVDSVDVFNPKTVRASMGSLFHLPVVVSNQENALNWLNDNNIALFGTSVADSVLYYDVDWRQSVCIVFGNEGQGVRPELLEQCRQNIHIPLLGKAESLNVSIAAAVILYEVLRQRVQA
jgi:TrmH family RNA methyltransferase